MGSINKKKFKFGPGLITMALAQGSGELIWWPFLIGKYGVSFLWLLPIAAFAQLPINYFLGRYTLITGKTFFSGLIEKRKRFAVFIWVLFTISFLWFGAYASAAGTALGTFVWPFEGDYSDRTKTLIWGTIILFFSFFVVILSKDEIYKRIKIFMAFISISTLLLLILSVIIPVDVRKNYMFFLSSFFPYFSIDFWQLSWWPNTWNPNDWPILISGLLFTGMGGFWNVLYSYWAKEEWGYLHLDSDNTIYEKTSVEKRKIFLLTRNNLRWDVNIGIIGNLITTVFISLLAFTYLSNSAELPNDWRLVVVQSKMFSGLWNIGPTIFICIAIMFLIDFWITTADAVARVHSDVLREILPKKYQNGNLYEYVIYFLAIITFMTMLWQNPKILFLINGIINALAMNLIIYCIYILNNDIFAGKKEYLRPNAFSRFGLLLSFIFFICGFVLYIIYS